VDLDAIVRCLAHHRQRATYGAVAAVVGSTSAGIGVMRGRPPNYLNSWVVSQKQHKPTNYSAAQIDPELEHVPFVISDEETLRRWLSTRMQPAPPSDPTD
jgi:hypothetical protein